jgi:hypothetical protein
MHVAFKSEGLISPAWNNGILEKWNFGKKDKASAA